jgi:hypothetical protein
LRYEWYSMAYYKGVEDYEKTRMRDFCAQCGCLADTEWERMFVDPKTGIKRDFEFAVGVLTMRSIGRLIDEWITVVEEGKKEIQVHEQDDVEDSM